MSIVLITFQFVVLLVFSGIVGATLGWLIGSAACKSIDTKIAREAGHVVE